MDQASYLVVRDLLFVAFAALGLGLPVYAILRMANPMAQWERQGNVWAAPFGIADLVLAIALIIFFVFTIPVGSVEEREITSQTLWANAFGFVLIVAVVLIFLAARGIRLVELFGLERMSPMVILVISVGGLFVAYAAVLGAKIVVDYVVMEKVWPDVTEEQALVRALGQPSELGFRLSAVFIACLVQPIAEEFLFRGYLYGVLKRFTDRYFSAIIVSLIFAAVHMHVPAIASLFALAIILTIAYEWSGSLWVPVTIHALFNAVTVVFITVRA